MQNLVLKNASQSLTFKPQNAGYRPEWFREGARPMLRFKDHEFLNIGDLRVIEGKLIEQSVRHLLFGNRDTYGSAWFDWTVRVEIPTDGKSGFLVTTRLMPLDEPVELLEAMSTFETPYEYDGNEHAMTFMCQQPVYRLAEGKLLNGAGYMHPHWYYGRVGRAHLTYQSASPLMAHRIMRADGSDARHTMIIGNWDVCDAHDMFNQPTRNLKNLEADVPFGDPQLSPKVGNRGAKFLIGAINWNNSLFKDPNVLVEPGKGLNQQVIVDFASKMPGGHWDTWLAGGWERMAAIHFPRTGRVGAFDVAKSVGASWVKAATWLSEQFAKPKGSHELFDPETGSYVYSLGTRPHSGKKGVKLFAAQWTGPLALLGHVWKRPDIIATADRLETIAIDGTDPLKEAEHLWTIGPTPMYCAMLRKASITGIADRTREATRAYVKRRAEFMLNPAPGARRGDPGILAWEAFANLLAANLYDAPERESAAKDFLSQVNAKLDGEFWTFNCAVEGDLVGAGQSRPFGHAIAATANMLAYRRFGDEGYLTKSLQFANLLLSFHFITWNESPSPDLDTRGWAHGSTGGRDQWAQLPPWETGHAIQQLAQQIQEGKGRDGFYDVLWLFAHTGLAQFPAARTMKRLNRPDMSITYRNIHELPTEREFYLRLPYLAYENPWDQTMLAGYQGVEPIVLSLLLGGGLIEAEDDRILALVPEAATFTKGIDKGFTVHLWNPTAEPIQTRLMANVAKQRNASIILNSSNHATIGPANPYSDVMTVPPRQVVKVQVAL